MTSDGQFELGSLVGVNFVVGEERSFAEESPLATIDQLSDVLGQIYATTNSSGDYDDGRVANTLHANEILIGSSLRGDFHEAAKVLKILNDAIDPEHSEVLPPVLREIFQDNQDILEQLCDSGEQSVVENLSNLALSLSLYPDTDEDSVELHMGERLVDRLMSGSGFLGFAEVAVRRFQAIQYIPEDGTVYNQVVYDAARLFSSHQHLIASKLVNGSSEEQIAGMEMVLVADHMERSFPSSDGSVPGRPAWTKGWLLAHRHTTDAVSRLIGKDSKLASSYIRYAAFGIDNEDEEVWELVESYIQGEEDENTKLDLMTTLLTADNVREYELGLQMMGSWMEKFQVRTEATDWLYCWNLGTATKGLKTDKATNLLKVVEWTPRERALKLKSVMMRNMEAMNMLEDEREGSVARLNHDFGIFQIARYPKEILIRQFDEIDDRIPFVMATFATEDWSESAYTHESIFNRLVGQIKGWEKSMEGFRLGLRIFEFSPVFSAAKLMPKSYRKYGSADAGWIVAHGNQEEIGLYSDASDRHDLGNWSIDTFKKFKHLYPYFKRGADVVLSACSTGRRVKGGENFAQALARMLDVRVLAPSRDAMTEVLSMYHEKDRLKMHVKYDGAAVTMYRGRHRSGKAN